MRNRNLLIKKKIADYNWDVPIEEQIKSRTDFLIANENKLADKLFEYNGLLFGFSISNVCTREEEEFLQFQKEYLLMNMNIIRSKLLAIYWEIKILTGEERYKTNGMSITPEDIMMARAVPISSLADFNKGNFMRSFYSRDKTASLQYYPETNSYYCRSTNNGGDSIKFVMDKGGIDFISAVKLLIGK